MRILIMGDSTMQQNYASTYPQVGWPQALPLFLNSKVEILNFARNGCSTKSFRDLGYFDKLLSVAKQGDYCFIEFGHNDQKSEDPLRYTEPFTTYSANLHQYIDELLEVGVTPIIFSPIYRRFFESNGCVSDICHGDYPAASEEVAKNRGLVYIDLTKLTKDLLSLLGDETSKKMYMYFEKDEYSNYPDGKHDNTHLRFDGAYLISKIVINELEKINHPLASYIKLEVKDE